LRWMIRIKEGLIANREKCDAISFDFAFIF
jgi:hypothetical protein